MRNKGTSLGTWAVWAVTGTATALALDPTSTAASANSKPVPSPTNADPGGRAHGPPLEAVDACANSNAGDACSFVIDERTIDGTCRNRPHNDESLVCMPVPPA